MKNKKRIAIVTGASTGIGKATAIEMAKAGYFVYLVARSAEKLKLVSDLILNNGNESTIVVTDLSDLTSINKLISRVSDEVESVSAIINIAGVWHGEDEVYSGKDYQDFDQKVILDTYTVGFTAPSLLVHGLLHKMTRGSKVVNLSGTFENGGKGWLPYFASKRALEDFTIGLTQELIDKNIQVNCISPSDTATEQYSKYFPEYMSEAIDPKKIAEKIIELCEENNKESGKVFVMKKDKEPFDGFHS